MKNNMNIIPLFAIPIVKTNIGRDFTKDEVNFITGLPMYKDVDQGMFNHRSKDFYLFDNFVEELKDIKNFCEHQLEQYLKEIEGADTDLATLRITQSWLNTTKPQERHHLHYHANCYLSGILYIRCLPDDHINFSNRSFGSYNNMEFPMKKPTVWNVRTLAQNIIEGDLIIFPSWMQHSVDLNKTKNKDRISLSFNAFPIGKMGQYKGSHLIL